MNSRRATLIGATAIVLWSTLALFTTLAAGLPPFELLTLSFATVFGLSAVALKCRGVNLLSSWRQPVQVWLVGVAGLFGYHLLYFVALATAPAIEANLINYLWPVLIVLFAACLPGERLTMYHIAGVILGLSGAGLLITGADFQGFQTRFAPGYLAALAAAVIWAGYSVANRRFAHVPTCIVTGLCGAVAVLAGLCHFAFETTVIPDRQQWLAVLALGAGPVGLAFFFWDYGTKHGALQLLGTCAYFTPLLSTLLLIIFGQATVTTGILASCGLIVAGAIIAGRSG